MPGADPPYDRVLALACRVRTLRAFWLEVSCCRGLVKLPLRPLAEGNAAGGRTLADVVVRLRCKGCGQPPAEVVLIETANAPLAAYASRPAWRLPLR